MKLNHILKFIFLTVSVLNLVAFAASPKPAANEKPNIVLIFNDDMGYADLSSYGAPKIKTPRIDQMAKEGMKLTSFYVASSVCSSSRAALMTGCYSDRVGVTSVFWPNQNHGLDPKYTTVAEVLKTVDYETMAVGKWHLGDELRFLPTNQGFDSYYGIPYSNDMGPAKSMKYAKDCIYREGITPEILKEAFEGELRRGNPKGFGRKVPLMRNEECIEFPADQRTITKRFADEGIKFMQQSVKKKKPFFLYLANSMPHVPLFVTKEFEGKSEGGLYGDVIEEIDFNTGRVLDEIKKLGIEDNTLVIFTSDNGPWLILKKHGGSALPLFEGKMTAFEGGHRVPCIVKWPKLVPAGVVSNTVTSAMDLLPTFAQIAGAKVPRNVQLNGKNIYHILTDKKGAKSPHKVLYYVKKGEVLALRYGDWKYHQREEFAFYKKTRKSTGPALYNLKTDIGESKNVIKENPEIAGRLAWLIEQFQKNGLTQIDPTAVSKVRSRR